jgi:uracil phosphoribosyltransferase
MHNGLLNVFDHSESAFVSAYRKHTTPEEFEIYVEYIAIPEMKGKIWIISDPMKPYFLSKNTFQKTQRFLLLLSI